MQIHIETLNETPDSLLQIGKLLITMSGKLAGSTATLIVKDIAAVREEIAASNATPAVQFGKQPLPAGAEALPAEALPLADAPSTAAAEASATAPAAPTAIAPPPPNVAPPAPPAPPAAATQAPAGDVKLDKHGLPWDERIHASSRALIADGSWRQKRGVDPAKVVEVEAQLRGQMGPAPKPDPLDNLKPEPAAPPPPAAAGEQRTFGSIARRVGEAVAAGRITQDHVSATLAGMGYPDGLYQALPHPDRWDLILETLGA